MSRIGPNTLLAIASGLAFALLLMTLTVYSPVAPIWRHAATGIVVTAAFLLLQPVARRLSKTPRRPLVSREASESAVWAAIYPGVLILMAAIPLVFSTTGLGLLAVIGGVIFGATVDSVLTARRVD